MATIVCQNLLESRTLRLKLELTVKSCFLGSKKDTQDPVYVHPLAKPRLSLHSLQMCTETLGSETGSDDGVFSVTSASPRTTRPQVNSGRRRIGRSDMPPPLTTISGSECVRIRSRREGGRVVMEAVRGPSATTCFRAERSRGRLRLFVFGGLASHETRKRDGGCERGDFEIDPFLENENVKERDGENDVGVLGGGEGMDGNYLKVGGKMGNEGVKSSGRCKEGCEKWEGYRALIAS